VYTDNPLLKTFTINLELRKPVAGQYLVSFKSLSQSATWWRR
jgi:hypothetical protein